MWDRKSECGGGGGGVQWEVDKLVCVSVSACDCMLQSFVCQPCQECVCTEIWSKPVGPQWGGVKKCESWSGRHGGNFHDLGKGCCYCLSPFSPRTPTSAVLWRQDGTKAVSLHPALLAVELSPHGVLTATITSFVSGNPAHLRGVLDGSDYMHPHTDF